MKTLCFVLLFFGFAAQAETKFNGKKVKDAEEEGEAEVERDSSKSKKTFSGKKIKARDNSIEADSSEANREGKSFDIVVEPIGFAVWPLPSFGLNLGYYLRPDAVAEFSLSRGSLNFLFFEIYSYVYSLRLKKFWGNSFYTNTGLAMREIGGRTTLNEVLGTGAQDEVVVSATSLALDLAIGNKWQFSNFTIGCDWVGALVPIAKMGTKDTYPTQTSQSREEDKASMERLAVNGSMQLLRFYLGASF